MNDIWIAWIAFAVLAASPGPSTMAIMGTSLAHGRGAGIRFASGVVTGSVIWGVLSAFGTAALLSQAAWMLTGLKIAGGSYFLFLAYKAGKSAYQNTQIPTKSVSNRGIYMLGLGLHLTNPKAIFSWTTIVVLGMPQGAPAYNTFIILAGCATIAIIINFGYAVVFSNQHVIQAYRRSKRWIDGTLAVIFTFAGIRLLTWRT